MKSTWYASAPPLQQSVPKKYSASRKIRHFFSFSLLIKIFYGSITSFGSANDYPFRNNDDEDGFLFHVGQGTRHIWSKLEGRGMWPERLRKDSVRSRGDVRTRWTSRSQGVVAKILFAFVEIFTFTSAWFWDKITGAIKKCFIIDCCFISFH